ncbi:MAG TPA: hypothetical protein VNO70_25060 [Blastocatellia bacterium]|nr:hypothetical protein [Blastocatellia bacterium]
MSGDDTTVDLNSPGDFGTKTGVESILERINLLEERMNARITLLEEKVNARIAELREEMQKGFRLIDRRLEHLLGEVSRLHGEIRDVEDRVSKLEQKPS